MSTKHLLFIREICVFLLWNLIFEMKTQLTDMNDKELNLINYKSI